MSETNKLVYLLLSTKDILGFDDNNDFKNKIKEDDFKIKVQKLVYLSKFFGWNNPYIFTLQKRGPYSVELKHIYNMTNLFSNVSEKIEELNLLKFRKFIKNKDTLFLEATTTILYSFRKDIANISDDECVYLIQSIKQHIPSEIIINAFNCIKTYKIFENEYLLTKEYGG